MTNFSVHPVRPRFTDAKIKSFMVVRAGNSARFTINFEVIWEAIKMTYIHDNTYKVISFRLLTKLYFHILCRPLLGLRSSGIKMEHQCLKKWPSAMQREHPSFWFLLLSAQTLESIPSLSRTLSAKSHSALKSESQVCLIKSHTISLYK